VCVCVYVCDTAYAEQFVKSFFDVNGRASLRVPTSESGNSGLVFSEEGDSY
jgi:hypothetical protein